MFSSPKDAIAYALRTSKALFHRYLDDLKPQEFEHQPCPGGNTAAWIVGHLVRTDRRSLGWLGAADLPPVPDGFEERFTPTRAAAAEQKGYGDAKELVALFDAHRDRLIAAVLAADEATLRGPSPMQTPLFADRGEALLFRALHTAMHLGQVSTLRRRLGYPPVS
ncbi:MAG TPA: DinB family protein, partial [Fimbriiglobus sp.]|nr:DinB family protein [Fimbriiglobus sp.]